MQDKIPESKKYKLDQNNFIEISLQTGRIVSLVLNGELVIRSQAPHKQLGTGCYSMFPFVNRLSSPKTEYPVCFQDGNGLPLHGVCVNSARNIKVIVDQADKIVIQLTLKEKIVQAPEFQELYILQHNKLTIKFSTLQQETKTIFCFGYHPFLQLGQKPIKQLQIATNLHKNLKLSKALLPIYPFDQQQLQVTSQSQYDHLFKSEDEQTYLQLIDNERNVSLSIKSRQLKYWQIYTPECGKRIAVEPMSFSGNLYQISQQAGLTPANLPHQGALTIEIKAQSH